jgi:cysteine desulfurase
MELKLPIYMDNNATTPIDPRVLAVMMPFLTNVFGNAASRNHAFGWQAQAAVDAAREQVAGLLGAQAKDIVFTSGATESNNLAIKGLAAMYKDKRHIVTGLTEHKAVIDPCERLAENGFDVTWLKPDEFGMVSPADVAAAIRPDTLLVSLMAANNETGTLLPIGEIGQLCKARGVFFHTDATQAIGKVELDVEAMGIDLLSLSGHKLYGPKGVGALYVRRRNPHVKLMSQMDGGRHERGLRSGTLNVPGIAGLGSAAEIAKAELTADVARLTALRDRLHAGIVREVDYVKLNGHPTQRLAGTLNVSFAFVEGESMMMKMRDLAVSSGSACTSASLEPSHVLRAMGVDDATAHSSIRFSLGRFNTEAEVDFAIAQIARAARELRELSPLYEMAQGGVDLSKVKWKHDSDK